MSTEKLFFEQNAKPFLKWAGGKRQLLTQEVRGISRAELLEWLEHHQVEITDELLKHFDLG